MRSVDVITFSINHFFLNNSNCSSVEHGGCKGYHNGELSRSVWWLEYYFFFNQTIVAEYDSLHARSLARKSMAHHIRPLYYIEKCDGMTRHDASVVSALKWHIVMTRYWLHIVATYFLLFSDSTTNIRVFKKKNKYYMRSLICVTSISVILEISRLIFGDPNLDYCVEYSFQ